MNTPGLTLLYVDNPEKSAAFYRQLLALEPVELSPTFALFVFDNGSKLGLWQRDKVVPPAETGGGGAEFCFLCASAQQVDALYQQLCGKNAPIIQPPIEMEFGYTFVATDPDRHRLRVYTLNNAS